MTRLPRDWTGEQLARALGRLGYEVTRQSGSHMRLTTDMPGRHDITVPRHDPLRVGTLGAILADVANHFGLARDELLDRLLW
ncbi:MAG: type II toxin-antitoxin system HicA family toxin [Dehalococcoidia bacterium]|nr:type II toxin-antitoxin system HicA family toxin [Dehalococcoidia bacterium]MCB9486768.1 type II toxin-antitoxin system HicA family toxin [Thermoflexaceae bacterium]